MKSKKWYWRLASLAVLVLFVSNPEIVVLVLFADAFGLDFLLVLFEVQLIAVFGFFIKNLVRPVADSSYRLLQRIDP